MDQGRHKKLAEKEAAGKNILMPEIFVSNHMKQQRNYVHYKRNKSRIELSERAASRFGKKEGAYTARTAPESRANENALLLVVRIKGYNTATSPQAQKILSDMGLRQINNAVFLHTTQANLTKITLVKEYIAFGYPTKKIVNDLIRKRGFLKKEDKKIAITDNVLIEELLGGDENSSAGCICIEDIIDCVWKCH